MTIFSLRPTTPNSGNQLIATATDALLRSVFGRHVNLVNLPADVGGSIKGAGLTPQTVYEINQLADGLIIGPGNLFENGALNIDPSSLAALTVPTMLLSVSTGRVFDRTGQLALRTDSLSPEKIAAICRISDPILVRDGATRDRLAALGCDRVQVVGCPTLFLTDTPLMPSDPESALADTVLISIRHPKLMSIPYSAQGRLYRDLRGIIDCFGGREGHVRLLCHDYQDLPFAQVFSDVPALYTEDPNQFLSWLRDCRLNITFRLHAFLACLALGTPSIPLSYDERSISLIETIGLSGWPVDFLQSECLLADLLKRSQALPRLQELTAAARPAWDGLHGLMVQGLEHFASRIEDYRSRRVF